MRSIGINGSQQDNDIIISFPNEPTHFPDNGMTPTTIDFYLTKNVTPLHRPISLPDLHSNHNPVIVEIPFREKQPQLKNDATKKFTDWTKFRKTTDGLVTINTDIKTSEELDREVAEFTNAIQKGYEGSTYLIKPKKRNDEIGDHTKQLTSLRNKESIKNKCTSLPNTFEL